MTQWVMKEGQRWDIKRTPEETKAWEDFLKDITSLTPLEQGALLKAFLYCMGKRYDKADKLISRVKRMVGK